MLAAFFVCYLLRATNNPDVLLLPDVWNIHRDIKSRLLLASKKRHSSLTLSLLVPFLSVLSSLPVADNASAEANLLRRLSNTISTSLPHLRTIRQEVLETVQPHIVRPLPLPNTPLSLATQKGLAALLDFVRELLPLIDDTRPAKLTQMQALVASKPNFFLPFREHAPHRQVVTGPGGPFHPSLCDEPGALPSAAIFRAILFGAPVLDNDTKSYFRNYDDWCALVDRFKHLDSEQLQRHFYDIHAYGTAQGHKPSMFRDHIQVYFKCETQWTDLIASHSPDPIPFQVCYQWTQKSTSGSNNSKSSSNNSKSSSNNSKSSSKPNPRRILPLHGGLTGYLLTADLSYTHHVTSPSVSDVAHAICNCKLGSLTGLSVTDQVGKNPSNRDIHQAFERVYDYLDHELTAQEKTCMVFDPIMVEHLLCKYQRVRTHLKKLQTKERKSKQKAVRGG